MKKLKVWESRMNVFPLNQFICSSKQVYLSSIQLICSSKQVYYILYLITKITLAWLTTFGFFCLFFIFGCIVFNLAYNFLVKNYPWIWPFNDHGRCLKFRGLVQLLLFIFIKGLFLEETTLFWFQLLFFSNCLLFFSTEQHRKGTFKSFLLQNLISWRKFGSFERVQELIIFSGILLLHFYRRFQHFVIVFVYVF